MTRAADNSTPAVNSLNENPTLSLSGRTIWFAVKPVVQMTWATDLTAQKCCQARWAEHARKMKRAPQQI